MGIRYNINPMIISYLDIALSLYMVEANLKIKNKEMGYIWLNAGLMCFNMATGNYSLIFAIFPWIIRTSGQDKYDWRLAQRNYLIIKDRRIRKLISAPDWYSVSLTSERIFIHLKISNILCQDIDVYTNPFQWKWGILKINCNQFKRWKLQRLISIWHWF